MDKGTIIYIGGFELPDKNAAAHRVLNNGKVLRELGYNVVFIYVDKSVPFNNSITRASSDIQGFECYSIPYPKVNKHWINYLCNIDCFIEVVKKYNNIKAVICYNYQSVAFIKIKGYCYKNNIKIISDCTEWYSTKGTNIIFKIIKGFDSFLRMRIIQKHLDGIIVISNYLNKYYNKCENVLCIPPLIDSNESKWKLKVSQYNDNKVHLIYAGSPGKNKDKINLLIEYLFQLKDSSNFILYIVGITREQYLRDYKSHRDIIGELKDKVNFLGRLSHMESLAYVKKSDFSILIRNNTRMTKAGFSTKFVESMTCGTPVITTRTSDLDDYLVEDKNGFFININDNKGTLLILEKILKLNREEIITMKKRCNNSLDFNYENYIDQMKIFFERIIR